MTATRPLTAAVLSRHLADPESWRASVLEALTRRDFGIDGDELHRSDHFAGRADLLSPGEAAEIYGDQPWFSLDDRGPLLGSPVGFFSWDVVSCDADADAMSEVVFQYLRGTVGRADTGQSHEPIATLSVPLHGLDSRRGFDDGDLFIARDDAYADAIVAAVTESLEQAGYEGLVGFNPDTHHNPLIVVGPLRRRSDGVEIEPSRELLETIRAPLLVFDWSVLDDDDFWRSC